MELEGLRVVRGPNWKWEDQDGGEGHVGTIISVKIDPLIVNTAIVQWDSGIRANYRIEESHDLRIFDNATVGVKHELVTCDSCMETPIRGIRWKCTICDNYDLCTTCYMTDKHDLTHPFLRIIHSDSSRVLLPKRQGAVKINAWGIFVDATVVRGPDWNWGNQDGGSGNTGTVVEIRGWNAETARNAVRVAWESGTRNIYQLGYKGHVDLKYKIEASGGMYYKDHLPIVESTGSQQSQSTERDVVESTITKLLSNLLGGGLSNDGSSNSPFSQGDAVRIITDAEKAKILQLGHGEWVDRMKGCLGKIGIVKHVYRSGDLRVYVNDDTWTFNPGCVTLVASGNDSGSANNSTTDTTSSTAANDELVVCAERGRLQNVKDLIASHPDWINMKSTQKNGRTALQVACYHGHMEIIRTLLNAKASLEMPDDDGDTPLHYAVFGNEPKVVELLLKTKSDIKDITNHSGRTPLHSAAVKQNVECVKVLLRYKCNVNKQDSYGDTALHDAITIGGNEIIDLLVSAPQADLSLLNKKGFNVLHHAALKGNEYATKRILAKKKELVNVKKNDGYTALHVAAVNNHVDVARILLKEGKCEVDPKNVVNKTPLALAIEEGHKPMIQLLVEHGADMSEAVRTGGSALPPLLTLLEKLAKS